MEYLHTLWAGVSSLWKRPQNELVRFFINNNIAPYLREPVQRHEFEANLSVDRTTVQFHQLDLDEQVLNNKFGPSSPVLVRAREPAGVADGFGGVSLHDVVLDLPWSNLANDPVRMRVSRVTVALCFRSDNLAAADSDENGRDHVAGENPDKSSTTSPSLPPPSATAAALAAAFQSPDTADNVVGSSSDGAQFTRDPFFDDDAHNDETVGHASHSHANQRSSLSPSALGDRSPPANYAGGGPGAAAAPLGALDAAGPVVATARSSLEALFRRMFANLSVEVGELVVDFWLTPARCTRLRISGLRYGGTPFAAPSHRTRLKSSATDTSKMGGGLYQSVIQKRLSCDSIRLTIRGRYEEDCRLLLSYRSSPATTLNQSQYTSPGITTPSMSTDDSSSSIQLTENTDHVLLSFAVELDPTDDGLVPSLADLHTSQRSMPFNDETYDDDDDDNDDDDHLFASALSYSHLPMEDDAVSENAVNDEEDEDDHSAVSVSFIFKQPIQVDLRPDDIREIRNAIERVSAERGGFSAAKAASSAPSGTDAEGLGSSMSTFTAPRSSAQGIASSIDTLGDSILLSDQSRDHMLFSQLCESALTQSQLLPQDSSAQPRSSPNDTNEHGTGSSSMLLDSLLLKFSPYSPWTPGIGSVAHDPSVPAVDDGGAAPYSTTNPVSVKFKLRLTLVRLVFGVPDASEHDFVAEICGLSLDRKPPSETSGSLLEFGCAGFSLTAHNRSAVPMTPLVVPVFCFGNSSLVKEMATRPVGAAPGRLWGRVVPNAIDQALGGSSILMTIPPLDVYVNQFVVDQCALFVERFGSTAPVSQVDDTTSKRSASPDQLTTVTLPSNFECRLFLMSDSDASSPTDGMPPDHSGRSRDRSFVSVTLQDVALVVKQSSKKPLRETYTGLTISWSMLCVDCVNANTMDHANDTVPVVADPLIHITGLGDAKASVGLAWSQFSRDCPPPPKPSDQSAPQGSTFGPTAPADAAAAVHASGSHRPAILVRSRGAPLPVDLLHAERFASLSVDLRLPRVHCCLQATKIGVAVAVGRALILPDRDTAPAKKPGAPKSSKTYFGRPTGTYVSVRISSFDVTLPCSLSRYSAGQLDGLPTDDGGDCSDELNAFHCSGADLRVRVAHDYCQTKAWLAQLEPADLRLARRPDTELLLGIGRFKRRDDSAATELHLDGVEIALAAIRVQMDRIRLVPHLLAWFALSDTCKDIMTAVDVAPSTKRSSMDPNDTEAQSTLDPPGNRARHDSDVYSSPSTGAAGSFAGVRAAIQNVCLIHSMKGATADLCVRLVKLAIEPVDKANCDQLSYNVRLHDARFYFLRRSAARRAQFAVHLSDFVAVGDSPSEQGSWLGSLFRRGNAPPSIQATVLLTDETADVAPADKSEHRRGSPQPSLAVFLDFRGFYLGLRTDPSLTDQFCQGVISMGNHLGVLLQQGGPNDESCKQSGCSQEDGKKAGPVDGHSVNATDRVRGLGNGGDGQSPETTRAPTGVTPVTAIRVSDVPQELENMRQSLLIVDRTIETEPDETIGSSSGARPTATAAGSNHRSTNGDELVAEVNKVFETTEWLVVDQDQDQDAEPNAESVAAVSPTLSQSTVPRRHATAPDVVFQVTNFALQWALNAANVAAWPHEPALVSATPTRHRPLQAPAAAELGDRVVVRALFAHIKWSGFAYPTLHFDLHDLQPAGNLQVQLADAEVEDAVVQSTWKRLFGFMSGRSNPHHHTQAAAAHNALSLDMTVLTRWLPTPSHTAMRVAIHCLPVRMFINQSTWDFIASHLVDTSVTADEKDNERSTTTSDSRNTSEPSQDNSSSSFSPSSSTLQQSSSSPTLEVQSFEINSVRFLVDYKPTRGAFSAVRRTGDFVYLLKMVPLEEGELVLRAVPQGVIPPVAAGDFTKALLSVYFPNWHRKLPTYFSGIQMVRVLVKLGEGAASLVRMPLQQYRRDGNVLLGVERGLKTFTVEVLSLGSRVSSLSYKILRSADNALRYPGLGADQSPNDGQSSHKTTDKGTDSDRERPVASSSSASGPSSTAPSLYSNQPETIRDGLVQGWKHVRDGVKGGLGAVTMEPYRQYQSHGAIRAVGAAVYGIPRMVIRPALGVSGAIGKITQGVKNAIDPKSKLDADDKWKNNNK